MTPEVSDALDFAEKNLAVVEELGISKENLGHGEEYLYTLAREVRRLQSRLEAAEKGLSKIAENPLVYCGPGKAYAMGMAEVIIIARDALAALSDYSAQKEGR